MELEKDNLVEKAIDEYLATKKFVFIASIGIIAAIFILGITQYIEDQKHSIKHRTNGPSVMYKSNMPAISSSVVEPIIPYSLTNEASVSTIPTIESRLEKEYSSIGISYEVQPQKASNL